MLVFAVVQSAIFRLHVYQPSGLISICYKNRLGLVAA